MLSYYLRIGLLAVSLGAALVAFGQDPTFIVPRASVLTESKAEISVLAGTKPVGLTDQSVRWVFVKTGGVQENRDSFGDWLAPDGSLAPTVPAPGGVMIGVDFQPKVEQMSSVNVSRLLGRPVSPSGPFLAVRHYRSAIALLRTAWGGDGDQSGAQVPTAETSLTCNIHALFDPTRLMLGGDLAFEVSVRGEEIEGTKLMVRDVAKGTTTVLRTREKGSTHFTPTSPGTYQIYFQTARELKGDPEASYELFSGSMTFEIPVVKEVGP